jgi:hypothetical protein
MNVYELSPQEIYDSFVQGVSPVELLEKGRIEIATRLRVDEGLKQEEAYFAADQILAHARRQIEVD